jgi:RNA polymerase sigma-70 factor (ECF subfamily)
MLSCPPAMKAIAPTDVTQLLQAWRDGDQTAQDKLWPIVFGELQRLAHRQMKQERPNHTLQTAALVNEVYVRLVGWKNASWKSRAHFYGMCARIMRQILVDYARARGYQRRGGDRPIESLDESIVGSPSKSDQLIALDEALTRLAAAQPRKASVIELRFFAGLSVEEIAHVLGVSRLTVIRDWNFSRAWLLAEMSGRDLPRHA